MTVQPIEPDATLVASGPDAPTAVSSDATVIAVAADATIVEMPPDAATIDRTKEAKKLHEAASMALQEGKFDEALKNADASLKLRKTARTHLLRAQALQRLERVNDALDAVDSAVELAPTHAPAFELRGRILWAAGRKDEARFAFEQFLALETDGPRAEAIRDLLRENR